MPKKIYDIKPPKAANKTENDFKEFLKQDNSYPARPRVQKSRRSRQKKEKRSAWLPISISGGITLLIIFIYLFFKLPMVQVSIWPKVETLSFEQKITADKSVDLIDSRESVIPARYFEASKTLSQDFPATGNASNEGRATGVITVYNKYDPPETVTLKIGTHFMSNSGKLFTALQKIVIPAAKKSGSKINPSSVQVKVQAAEGGDSYNIAPSEFSVPGLKGTAYYYSIYAESSEAMAGGYQGQVKKVTADDIQGAKDVLVKRATEDAISSVKSQIPDGYILLDNAILYNTASASTQTKVGAITDKFFYSATVKASGLAFKKSDLDEFAKKYIISQLGEGKTLLDNSFKIDYSVISADVSGGKATLNLNFSSGNCRSIDKNSLALSLIGKNYNQINETINNSLGEEVYKTEINFWPFWVRSAPNNQKAVKIELKF